MPRLDPKDAPSLRRNAKSLAADDRDRFRNSSGFDRNLTKQRVKWDEKDQSSDCLGNKYKVEINRSIPIKSGARMGSWLGHGSYFAIARAMMRMSLLKITGIGCRVDP